MKRKELIKLLRAKGYLEQNKKVFNVQAALLGFLKTTDSSKQDTN